MFKNGIDRDANKIKGLRSLVISALFPGNAVVTIKRRFSPMTTSESGQEKATRLLKEQLKELQSVRGLSGEDPAFTAWLDTTTSFLKRFLSPTSPHLTRFVDIPFLSQSYPAPPGHEQGMFAAGCKMADETIRAVLREIEEFGVHIGQAKPEAAAGRRGGMQQNFYGNVTFQNQAIATDSAIQKIGHMGDTTGASLKKIADVFKQSEELTRREAKEGLAGIEALAVEVQKPVEKRNWKSVLECGRAVLAIADKATDLAHKLAPYLPSIVGLVEKAKHMLG